MKSALDIINVPKGRPVKMWTKGVPVENEAKEQLVQAASLPFIFKHIAVMPDVHAGKGSTIGSVIPTIGAIIPAAVGVDIGCGMMAVRTSLHANDLPKDLSSLRVGIEQAVPHGREEDFRKPDKGAWQKLPKRIEQAWALLEPDFKPLAEKYPRLAKANHRVHLGTLGTGNHFIEVCLDEEQMVWIMLHSGSRGIGNAIGSTFIEIAKKEMKRYFIDLPNADLAYLVKDSEYYNDYLKAVHWAQRFAQMNRELMMEAVIDVVEKVTNKAVELTIEKINCHHNYVQFENHFGSNVLVTRKGAVSAKEGEMGIIPGSMGARSYIVRGKGNPESFHSCSHGAGRTMSRTEAKRRFTVEDQIAATQGVECRKDADVIDEIPMAYKDIDAVMAAQADLVDIVYTLRQVVCVKG